MVYIDCEIIFHLYSIDETLKHPGLDEDGDVDIEFVGNILVPSIDRCLYGIWAADPKLTLIPEASSPNDLPFFANYVYEHNGITVNMRARVDCKPWPQKKTEEVRQRQQWAANGELGQRWWIHHITLPGNEEVDGDGPPIFDTGKVFHDKIRDYILLQIEKPAENK